MKVLYTFFLCICLNSLFASAPFQHYFGGSKIESGIKILSTENGWIVIGNTSSYGNISNDVMIVRYDSTGQLLMQKVIGDSLDNTAADAVRNYNGDIFIVGNLGSDKLMKVNSSGDVLWKKDFSTPLTSNVNSVLLCDDGNLLLAGKNYVSATAYHIYLIKVDQNGDLIWTNNYPALYSTEANCLVNDGSGGYLAAGNIVLPDSSGYLIHVDSIGNLLGSNKYDLGYGNNGMFSDIIRTMSGDYCLTGTSRNGNFGERFIQKIDPAGNIIFYNGPNGGPNPHYSNELVETPDSGFVTVGCRAVFDVFPELTKYDKNGIIEWERRIENPGTPGYSYYSEGYSLVMNNDFTFTYCGGFSFQPYQDGLIVKTDQNGFSTPVIPVEITSSRSNFCDSSSVSTILHAPSGYREIEWKKLTATGYLVVGTSNSDTLLATEAAIYSCIVSNGDLRIVSKPYAVTVAPFDSSFLTTEFSEVNSCSAYLSGINYYKGYNYEWKRNGVIITNSQDSLLTSGIYTIRTFNECGSYITDSIVVNNESAPPHQTLSMIYGGFCDSVGWGRYIITSPSFQSSYTTLFQMFRNDTLVSSKYFSPDLFVTSSGVYKMITTNECGSDTSDQLIVSGSVSPNNAHLVEEYSNTLRIHHTQTGILYSGYLYLKPEVRNSDFATYQWYKDGVLVETSTSEQFSARSPGAYCYFSSNPCGSAYSDTFNVVALPFNDSIQIYNTGRCNGRIISAPEAAVGGIQWYKDGMAVINANTETLYATDSGYYYCTFYITNAMQRTFSDTVYFPNQAEYNIVVSDSGYSGCSGDTVKLHCKYPANSYQWYKDDVLISGVVSRNFDATITGRYECEISNANCIEKLYSVDVSIGQPYVYSSNRYICPSQSVSLVTSGGLNYQWYIDSIAIPGANLNSLNSIVTPGTYWCSMTTICGNVTTDTIQISNASVVVGLDPTDTTILCVNENFLLTVPYHTDWKYEWVITWNISSDSSDYLLKWSQFSNTSQRLYDVQLEVTSVSEHCMLNNSHSYFKFTENGIKDIYSEDPLNSCGIIDRTLKAKNESGLTRQWFFNNDTIPGAVDESFISSIAGSYSTITTNNLGCSYSSNVLELKNDEVAASIVSSSQLLICNSSPIQLDLVPAYSNCQWFKDGIIIPGSANPSLVVSSSGNYTARFEDGSGCHGESSVTVLNPDFSLYRILSDSILSVCAGNNVVLRSTNYSYLIDMQWLLNGFPINSAVGQTYIADTAGIYSLQIEKDGCLNIVDSVEIRIGTNPTAAIASDFNSFCIGDSLLLSATLAYGNNYQWLKNGIAVSGAFDPYYYVSQTGNYSCNITSACGSAVSNSLAIGTSVNVTSNINLIGSDSICSGSSAQLNVVSNGSTLQWYKDGVVIPVAIGSTFNADQSGTYSCLAGNSCSSLSSNSISIVVSDSPTGNINSGFQNVICGIDTTTLSVITFYADSYQWMKNGIAISGATSANLDVYDAGFYYCELVNSCGTSTTDTVEIVLSNSITVAPDPISGNDTICPGLAGNIYNTSTVVGADWYNWNTDYGIDIVNGQQTISVEVFFDPGFLNGELYVQAGNSCGFGPVTSIYVTGDTSCIVDGLSEMYDTENSLSLVVFPNPSASSFRYFINSGNSTMDCRVRLIDLQGRVLIEQGNIKVGTEYEIGADLSFGIYELQIIQKEFLTRARLVKVN